MRTILDSAGCGDRIADNKHTMRPARSFTIVVCYLESHMPTVRWQLLSGSRACSEGITVINHQARSPSRDSVILSTGGTQILL